MRFILICTIIVLSFNIQAQESKVIPEVSLKYETVADYDTQAKENFLNRDSYFNFTQANQYFLKSTGFETGLYKNSFTRKTESVFVPPPRIVIPDWKMMTLGVLLDAGQDWIHLNYGQ